MNGQVLKNSSMWLFTRPTVFELDATRTSITCITNRLETDGRDTEARDTELLSSDFQGNLFVQGLSPQLVGCFKLSHKLTLDADAGRSAGSGMKSTERTRKTSARFVGQTEELSLIADFMMFSFPCFPFGDLMGSGRGAVTWFVQGIRTFAGAI
jgi:hypothetical protein